VPDDGEGMMASTEPTEYMAWGGRFTTCVCGHRAIWATQEEGIGGRNIWHIGAPPPGPPPYDEEDYRILYLGCPSCGRIAFTRGASAEKDYELYPVIDRADVALAESEILEDSRSINPGDVFRLRYGDGDLRVRAVHDEPVEAITQEGRFPFVLAVAFIYVGNGSIVSGASYLVCGFRVHEGIGDRQVVDTSVAYVPIHHGHPSQKWHQDEASAMREFEILKNRTPQFEARLSLQAPTALSESFEVGTVLRDAGNLGDYTYKILDSFCIAISQGEVSQVMLLQINSDSERKTWYGLGVMRHEDGIGNRTTLSKNLIFARPWHTSREKIAAEYTWYANRVTEPSIDASGTTEVMMEEFHPISDEVAGHQRAWMACSACPDSQPIYGAKMEPGIGNRETWREDRWCVEGTEDGYMCARCGRVFSTEAPYPLIAMADVSGT
jgi:hypothetical protein